MKVFYLSFLLIFIGCATTNTYVQPGQKANGKKIGLGNIKITQQIKGNKNGSDTVCACIAQTVETALTPYLNTAGYRIFNLATNKNLPDSLQKRVSLSEVDYILKGTGIVKKYGTTNFMEQLSIEIQDSKTGEVIASSSFTGVSIRPIKAAQKIGNDFIKKMK